MSHRKLAVCVSTSKPASSLTAGGGGGSIAMICPHTGSILSSMRTTGDNSSKSLLGVSSLSKFPQSYATLGPPLMMAYGGTTTKRDDTYGMLLSLRPVSSPPLLQWKCRLPEAQLSSGLLVSPCGDYIVGGGASGTCFVWNALGGALVRAAKAHYRSVTSMAWSDCGSFLVTGGADGMVHAFSLLDLVSDGQTVNPLRTWSVHHLPVTALLTMPSGRMVSASEDGQVVLIELFSEKVIATIQMPHAVRSLAHDGGRLFAGSLSGSIYLVDLDLYAVHQTSQLGVITKRMSGTKTHQDQVFSSDRGEAYKTELLGHEKPVTSLAVLTEDSSVWLVSGDEAGEVRIWDMESRGCVRNIRPWAHSATGTTTPTTSSRGSTKTSQIHPVTSIMIVPRGDGAESQESALGSFDSRNDGKSKTGIVSLVTPLQRFIDRPVDNVDEKSLWVPVPFLQPKRDRQVAMQRDSASTFAVLQNDGYKRPRIAESIAASRNDDDGALKETTVAVTDTPEEGDEVLRLRKELEEARSTIQKMAASQRQTDDEA